MTIQSTNFVPRQTLITAAWLNKVDGVALKGGDEDAQHAWVTSIYAFMSDEQIQDSRSGRTPTLDLTSTLNTALTNMWAFLNATPNSGNSDGSHGIKIIVPPGSYLLEYLDLYPGMTIEGANMHECRFIQKSTSTALRFFNVLARNGYNTRSRVPNVLLRGITLYGDSTLGSACDGLATENPSQDPDYSASKTYNSITTEYVSVLNFTGDGIKVANRGRGWFSHTRTQSNTGHGFNIQGPDCFLLHPASGSNGKHSIYCDTASTPRIIDGEVWASVNDSSGYVAIYMKQCREFAIMGGDINGPIYVEGGQASPSDPMYGYWGKGIITGVDLKFRASNFTDDDDGAPYIVAGYIMVSQYRGLTITSCTFTPSYNRNTNACTYRPLKIVDLQGECSVFFDCALPALLKADGVTQYGLWPAGSSAISANTRSDVFSSSGKVAYRYSCPDKEGDQPKFYQSQARLDGEATGVAPANGEIGQTIETTTAVGSAVALTTATVVNMSSITLTPGRWEIRGNMFFGGTGATGTVLGACVSTANNTFSGTGKLFNRCSIPFTTLTSTEIYTATIVPYTINVTANTTYYFNARATFSAGTMNCWGHIEAVRIS